MLWIKTLHILFVTSWFAGLFYLPRILVNLAADEVQTQEAVYQRLILMAQKLYRFMNLLMVLALAFGLMLWLYYGIGRGPGNGWMHAKLALVMALIGYHHICGSMIKKFVARKNQRSHVWFRYFNEVPVFILLLVLILVVVKPF